jgi:hypothetical protein
MATEFRILEPCTRDRDSLEGQGAVRWCPGCRKNVYDFALLRRDEIAHLTAAGKICAIIDPKPTLRHIVRRRFLRWAAALSALPLRIASAQQLRPGKGGLRGAVADAAGAPIENANLSLGKGRTVSSSDLGRFEFMNLTPGVYSLSVDAPGFERRRLDVTITAGKVTDVGTVSWLVGTARSATGSGSVSGVVVDWSRTFLAGAQVEVRRGTGSPTAVATANDRGRFVIEDLPSGKYLVKAQAPGFRRFEKAVIVGTTRLELGELVLQVGFIGEVVEIAPEPSPVRR